jgi:hypothetical protein
MSRPLPGHRIQIDVKFIQPLPGTPKPKKYYEFTAIDDCTRLRVLRIYPKLNQHTAIQFLDYVLERRPFRVEVIQTDNGVEFGSSFHWQSWARASAMSTSGPARPGSMARSSAPTASTPRSSRLLEGSGAPATPVLPRRDYAGEADFCGSSEGSVEATRRHAWGCWA